MLGSGFAPRVHVILCQLDVYYIYTIIQECIYVYIYIFLHSFFFGILRACHCVSGVTDAPRLVVQSLWKTNQNHPAFLETGLALGPWEAFDVSTLSGV